MINKLLLTCCFIVIQLSAQTKNLNDGTKVMDKKFGNINKFETSILDKIDVDYFYRKIDFYMADKNFNKIRGIGHDVDRKIQFYRSGHLRFFSLGNESPNPEDTGRRGIIYKKNNSLKIDTQFADETGYLSKGTYTIKIEKDKIYLLDDNFLLPRSEYICFVYQKSDKIPENWNNYVPNW